MFIVMSGINAWAFYRIPAALPADAPAVVFSEGRVMQHVNYLSKTIGHRQVSTKGLDDATEYLYSVAKDLADLAARTRPDLVVEPFVEQVSGSMNLSAFGHSFGNAYGNMTNVILKITPTAATGVPGVLVNSHYDSALGSVGASDAASCVGVILELGRLAIADRALTLSAPLVLLMNGAEESLMQGAHGFARHSPHAAGLGAFVNLESTGNWGPDVLFQSTQDWTLPAYARVAPHPRGNTIFQNFFDLGLIPADTDYRLLAYRRAGSLPGIDVAQVFDGLAYHTNQDIAERIRPGTLQSMGENTVAAVLEFGRLLAAGDLPSPELHGDGYVAFDVAGLKMVVYSYSTARLLHQAPLAALVALAVTASFAPELLPRGLQSFTLRGAVVDASRAILSVLLAHAVPAALGALRAAATGAPLVWYGRYAVTYAVFVPGALVGLLLPYLPPERRPQEAAVRRSLGAALAFAALAAALARSGLFMGYIYALWAVAALAAAMVLGWVPGTLGTALAAVVATAPILVTMPVGVTAMVHVAEKVGLAGSVPGLLGLVLGDTAVGFLSGSATYLSLGTLTAHLAFALRRPRRFGVLVLFAVSVAAAGAATAAYEAGPYTAAAPKRLFVQQVHSLQNDAVILTEWAVAGMDGFPAASVLPADMRARATAHHTPYWESMYPLSRLMHGVTVSAGEEEQGSRSSLPTLRTVGYGPAPGNASLVRWELELSTEQGALGVVNVTGPLAAWSLTDVLDPVPSPGGSNAHLSRYSSGHDTPAWRWWMEAAQDAELELRVHVSFLDATPALEAMRKVLPDWVSPVMLTTYQAEWGLHFQQQH